MNTLPTKKNQALQEMANMELYPEIIEEEISLANYTKLPFSRVAALGIAFNPITSAFQSVVSGGAQSGLYQVTVPAGGHLAKFNNGSGYLGSVLNDTSNQIAGQATLSPIVCDPTMLFMAAALGSIDKKLDKIQESQQEILDFLIQKDRAELKGDLLFLSDVLNNYKYNWNNEKYKNSNHIKVLDIKQTADRKIIFCRGQISAKCSKKSFLHSAQDVKNQLDKVRSDFNDYQLALYLYSFSSFLEIMLLENFEAAFLNGIVNKIEDYSFQYQELYTKCYNQIEDYSKSSIQSRLLKGLSSVSSAAGKTIEKVPIINKTQIDEALIDAGDRISDLDAKCVDGTMNKLIGKQSSYIRPFIENIKIVNRLYNEPMHMLFDSENLYLEVAS